VTDFLQEMISSADPFAKDANRMDVTVLEAIDQGAARIDTEFADQPATEGAVRYAIGWAYFNLGAYEKAEPHLRRALLLQRQSETDLSANTAQTYWALARALQEQKTYAEADSLLLTLHSLLHNAPEELEPFRRSALMSLGFGSMLQGKYERAAGFYEQVLPLLGTEPSDALGQALHAYGVTQSNLGHKAAAESLYRASLAVKREFWGPEHPDVAECMGSLAYLLKEREACEEAIELGRESLTMNVRLVGHGHPFTEGSVQLLARILQAQGRHEESQRVLVEFLEEREALFGTADSRLITTLTELGYLARQRKEYEDADRWTRRALAIARETYGDDHAETGWCVRALAHLALARGHHAEAETLHRTGLEIYRKAYGNESSRVAACLHDLALRLQAREAWSEAEPLWHEAAEIRRHALGEDSQLFRAAINNLGFVRLKQEKYADAEPALRDALSATQRSSTASESDLIPIKTNLARSLAHQGKHTPAATLFAEVLEALPAAFPEGPFSGIARGYYGESLMLAGRYAEAEEVLLAAFDDLEAMLGAGHERTKTIAGFLAELYAAWGRAEQEAEWRAVARGE
jgi:tetratricopeptide (TPR) repeat protein